MELSINEKAASFIWRKCERDEKSQSTYDRDTDKFTCLVCGYVGYAEHYTRHGLEAPDMSLPVHWVKALENVGAARDDLLVKVELVSGVWYVSIRPAMTADNWKRPVEALAALHDAEAGDSR